MKDNLKRLNYERLFALFVFIISRLRFLSSSCGIHLTIFSVNDVISIFDVIFLRTWLFFSELVCLFVCFFFWNYGSVNESTTWISQAIFIIHLAGLMGFKLFKKTDSKSETRRRSFSFLTRRSCSREERRSEDLLRPRRTGEGQSPEVRRSQEVASALRKIGDELNNSTLSLHSAATT